MATIFKSPSGSSIGSVFEVDTYAISLIAGITYQITLFGYAMDNYTGLSLKDPLIKEITYQGFAANKLVSNVNNDNYPADDTWQTGEQMFFTPTKTGVYNVGVGVSGLFAAAGTYELLVTGSNPVSTISTKPSSGNDSITGTSGNDTIDGLAGADTMIGGLGNDIYLVDNVGDVVVETSTLTTEKDTVKSSVSYTMPANVETLLLGAGAPGQAHINLQF
jgi:Ca2+-binding RTX toxin-like protein